MTPRTARRPGVHEVPGYSRRSRRGISRSRSSATSRRSLAMRSMSSESRPSGRCVHDKAVPPMKLRPAMSSLARAARVCPMRWSRLTWPSATRNMAAVCLRSRGSSIVLLSQSSRASRPGTLALLRGQLVDEVPVDHRCERAKCLIDNGLVDHLPSARCCEVDQRLLGGRHPTRAKLRLGALNVKGGDISLDEQDASAEHAQVRSLLRNRDDGRRDLTWDRAESASCGDMRKRCAVEPVVGLRDPHSGRMNVGPPGLVAASVWRHPRVVARGQSKQQAGSGQPAKVGPGVRIDVRDISWSDDRGGELSQLRRQSCGMSVDKYHLRSLLDYFHHT